MSKKRHQGIMGHQVMEVMGCTENDSDDQRTSLIHTVELQSGSLMHLIQVACYAAVTL